MYDLHSLHGQFSGPHFIISCLKACNDIFFLNSLGTKFQIFERRNEILSVPRKALLTFGNSNCENCRKLQSLFLDSNNCLTAEGDIFLYTLNIPVARTYRFLMCIGTDLSVSNSSMKEDFLSL